MTTRTPCSMAAMTDVSLARRRCLQALAGAWSAMVTAVSAQTSRPLRHGLVLRREHGEQGFPFLYHPPSGKWVGQEIQLAVPASRPLPVPLEARGQEALMKVSLFGGLTIEDANIAGGIANRQVAKLENGGDWYWWWINKPMGDTELKRPQRLGVQVFWPDPLQPDRVRSRRADPMELFVLPEIDLAAPGQWSPWRRAESVVEGASAAQDALRGKVTPNPETLLQPFELRARAGLWDTPYRPRG